MRVTSRIADMSINTVTKLFVKAGETCAEYHDVHVRDIEAMRVQSDEMWSFVYAKQNNVAKA